MSFRLNSFIHSFIHESLLVFSSVQVEAGVGEVVRPPTDVGCSLLPGLCRVNYPWAGLVLGRASQDPGLSTSTSSHAARLQLTLEGV